MKKVTKSEGNGMNIGEEFHPSPKMMLLYFTYLVILMIPLYAIGFGILFLLSIVLGLSVITSRLAEKNKVLTQEVVLLKKRVGDLEKSQSIANPET
jgi:hypothetical protein